MRRASYHLPDIKAREDLLEGNELGRDLGFNVVDKKIRGIADKLGDINTGQKLP